MIIFSIFISFYIEDVLEKAMKILKQNELVGDLIVSLEDDLVQIDNLIDILRKSENNILELLNDIDSESSDTFNSESIKKLLEIEVGISFFPKMEYLNN